MWYRRGPYGRRGGIWGFPFMLFFIALFVFHSWFGFILAIGLFIVLGLILRAVFASGATNSQWGQQPYQPPQQPYQQYYQPYQQPYQQYEEGYQPPAATYQEPEQQHPQPQYDEQPQVQYPQELPPMKQ